MKAQRRELPQPSKAHLLVVEDEEDLRELLVYNLARDGYRVTAVESGEQGLLKAMKEKPDLIVLDLMLPGMDGLEVCRSLKNQKDTAGIPIVMLTAKGEESDIVAGLELGSDDYITKPFSPRVLVARIKAVLRRKQEEREQEREEGTLEVNGMVISPSRHEVRIGEERVDLTATEFKLLMLLARRPGRVFTRQQIIENVHGGMSAVTDRSVDVQVVTLRRKLGERGDDIETVRGVGYRFRD
jgi:two-component system alkaline phosphatase synthesis response regulator PhoP